jgi:hypothetical protein
VADTFRSGRSIITADFTPIEAMLAEVDEASALLAQEYRLAAESAFRYAFDLWPVATGRSRSGLGMGAGVDPNGVIYARIYHAPAAGDNYTRFVRITNPRSFRIALAGVTTSAPVRARNVQRVTAAGDRYEQRERVGRAAKGPPAQLYALTHLLRVPWQRNVVPHLAMRTEALLADTLGAK